jgi:hypothetical protein
MGGQASEALLPITIALAEKRKKNFKQVNLFIGFKQGER